MRPSPRWLLSLVALLAACPPRNNTSDDAGSDGGTEQSYFWGVEYGGNREFVDTVLKVKLVKHRFHLESFPSTDGVSFSPSFCLPRPDYCIEWIDLDLLAARFKESGWSLVPMLSYNPLTEPVDVSRDMDKYVNWVAWFVDRYAADASIRYLELINYPAEGWGRAGTEAKLLEVSNRVYDRIKASHPTILVGTPGFEYWNATGGELSAFSISQAEYFLDASHGARFDFWAFHGYATMEQSAGQFLAYPPTMTAASKYAGHAGIVEVRKRLDANGWQARPIIDMEGTWAMPPSATFTDAQDQVWAAVMAQDVLLKRSLEHRGRPALGGHLTLKLAARGGAGEFLMGSLKPDGSASRHASAFGLLINALVGSRHTARLSGEYDQPAIAWVERFEHERSGREVYVYFKPFENRAAEPFSLDGQTVLYTLTLPSVPKTAKLTDLDGTSTELAPAARVELQAVNTPRLLEVTY